MYASTINRFLSDLPSLATKNTEKIAPPPTKSKTPPERERQLFFSLVPCFFYYIPSLSLSESDSNLSAREKEEIKRKERDKEIVEVKSKPCKERGGRGKERGGPKSKKETEELPKSKSKTLKIIIKKRQIE